MQPTAATTVDLTRAEFLRLRTLALIWKRAA